MRVCNFGEVKRREGTKKQEISTERKRWLKWVFGQKKI